MKQIAKVQIEATLRRLLDVRIMQDMIYFETVVWVEAKSLQPKGYFVLLVCKEMLYLMELDEKGHLVPNVHPVEIPLLNVTAIERLRDPAKFLEAELARDTQHIRLSVDDQVAIDEFINLYVIFEDSHVHCYLETAWLALQMTLAWPEMASQSRCELALRLNIQDSSTLFRALREQLLTATNRAEPLENIAVVIGLNQFVKKTVLQTPEVLSAAFDSFSGIAPLHGCGYFESSINHVNESTEKLPMLNMYIAVLIFYFQLLSGGVHYPDRLVLLDGTFHTVEAFIDSLLCLPNDSEPKPIYSSQKSLVALQPPLLTKDRSLTVQRGDALIVQEQTLNLVQRKLIEIDHLQTAVLFLFQKLIEYGTHTSDCSIRLESDFLLKYLLASNEFCEKRIPRSFQRVVHLLRLPTTTCHGLFLYMHCFMLNWYCDNSASVRQIIRTKCFTEMQLFSGLLKEKRTPNRHDSLFYQKGKALLQMVLDNILTDIDAN